MMVTSTTLGRVAARFPTTVPAVEKLESEERKGASSSVLAGLTEERYP